MSQSARQQALLSASGKIRHDMALGKYLKLNWPLYIMVIPGLVIIILFSYLPMFGISVAFQNYSTNLGFFKSEFVGFKHFAAFLRDPFCFRLIRNTVVLGIENLLISFTMPIIFALFLNELRFDRFKRVVQTISYMPYFLSTVVVIGLAKDIFSATDGPVNGIREMLGLEKLNFFSMPSAFRPLYIGTGIWASVGYSSIIYLAAIAGVNPEMYESAVLDGATRVQQIWYITLPSIMPTITILFIMAVGGILGNDVQKILLMYSERTYSTADVIGTYVYRYGIESSGTNNLSYSSAVGLLFNVISVIFLFITNTICNKLGDVSLF